MSKNHRFCSALKNSLRLFISNQESSGVQSPFILSLPLLILFIYLFCHFKINKNNTSIDERKLYTNMQAEEIGTIG